MALSVIIRSGQSASQEPRITLDAPRIVIGRGKSCEVRLPDPSVSQRHASIRQRGSDYILLDEGSANGTFMGGVRLPPQAPRVIRSGDLVRVGRVWLELVFDQAAPDPNAKEHTAEMALSLVSRALRAEGRASAARVSTTREDGPYVDISDFERCYVVGRSHADLTLDDPDVSRRHLEIMRRGEDIVVRDAGSKNGSTLNGARLVPLQWQRWDPSAPLKVGSTELRLSDPLAEALEELEQAAEEHLHPEEPVEPPEHLTSDGAEWVHGISRTIERTSKAPREAARSEFTTQPPPAQQNRRVGPGEIVIGLLALIVLLSSVLGLVWLFGAG